MFLLVYLQEEQDKEYDAGNEPQDLNILIVFVMKVYHILEYFLLLDLPIRLIHDLVHKFKQLLCRHLYVGCSLDFFDGLCLLNLQNLHARNVGLPIHHIASDLIVITLSLEILGHQIDCTLQRSVFVERVLRLVDFKIDFLHFVFTILWQLPVF